MEINMDAAAVDLGVLLDALWKSRTGDAAEMKSITTSAPVLSRDLPVIAAFALIFFCFNWGLRLMLVEPLSGAIFSMRSCKVRKLAQSVMEAIFYGCFTYVGFVVVPSQPWVWPSDKWWRGFLQGGHEIMRADLRCYYLMYIARYAQMVFSVMLEPKRKDFLEMLLHHLVTVVVTFVSYMSGWNRIGVVTMLLLDPADVPLHLAKFCKYAAESTKRNVWQVVANRFFEVFAVTFFITRLIMFSYVVWSAFIEGTFHIPQPGIQGWTCLTMLATLLILQLYWFYLIMKVAIRLAWDGSGVEDVRSDDEASPRKPDQADAHVEHAAKRKSQLLSRLLVAVPVIIVFVWQAKIAYRVPGGLGTVLADLQVLLSGLVTVSFSGPSVKGLPHSAPDIPRDSAVFVVLTLVFFSMNWGLRLLVVEPIVRSVLRMRGVRLAKYTQSVMEVLLYGSFTLIGLRVVPSQEWVWPSAKWWMGFSDGGHEIMRSDLRCYYLMYISRYFQAVLSVLLEPKRKDFVEMVVHHVATVVVIYISYLYGWNRVGVVVMALLDPADVPLHLAKLCKYTAEATKRQVWQFVADRLFEVFALVFFATRLVCYGYVCWSAHIEATEYFPKGLPEWTCVALLYTLLLLQVYWFFLIIKVAVKLIRGLNADDPRSDDSEEDNGPESRSQEKKKDK